MEIFSMIASIILLAATAITGVGYLIGQWRKGKHDGQRELDTLDEKLINRQKQAIDNLEKRVFDLESQQAFHKTEINRLTIENAVVTRVLQGRDENTLKFQTEGFKAMEVAHQIYELTIATNHNVERLVKAIEKHLGIIESIEAQKITVKS